MTVPVMFSILLSFIVGAAIGKAWRMVEIFRVKEKFVSWSCHITMANGSGISGQGSTIGEALKDLQNNSKKHGTSRFHFVR
jgi:hypothetical protein